MSKRFIEIDTQMDQIIHAICDCALKNHQIGGMNIRMHVNLLEKSIKEVEENPAGASVCQ